MTYQNDCTLSEQFLDQLCGQGLDALPELIRIVLNNAMQLERQKFLGAAPHERTEQRTGYANGYKDKTLDLRVGRTVVQVPQTRDAQFSSGGSNFYPQSLEKGTRSERALKLALAEMYIQGVSTRKVAAITEQLCGFDVTSSAVSRATQELDAILQEWRERSLGEFAYLYLDARYESVHLSGLQRRAAVLIAIGVDLEGKRQVLGVSVAISEHEVHWRSFLQSLLARGLRGVRLVVSDAHEGIQAATRSVLGGVPWQRCRFHLQQNASKYVPKQDLKVPVAADIRAIFNAQDRMEAEALLKRTVQKYEKSAPKLADWMEQNLPEGMTVFAFPVSHRRLLRTTNGLERVNRELRRRTRVASIFPNEASCLRLVSALLMEISDDWQSDKAYLTFTNE
ncbi:transposase for insertion sequence element ISRM5 [Capsulimonas corticalis]|uniref:Mutator family transposase n=1 Tax=Capsulimonas corticalis TaxID=2219043 RepID=A0A402D6V2_9BACT|nr:IS256 family transposase [Capsulimonas corticalis]BDI31588.1 transposase for insertion sequence element ISRM5 [Capsulimonas corticalis]